MATQENYVFSGRPATDAMAAQRKAKFPPVVAPPQPCQGCSKPTGAGDFWVCMWVYYFSRLGIISLLAPLVGWSVFATARVPHATYHWLCSDCARRAKGQRIKSAILRFIGLFMAGIGLIGSMAVLAALFLIPLSQRDRTMAQSWAWLPLTLLAVGMMVAFVGQRLALPGVLGELSVRPFFLELFFPCDPEKLDQLQGEFPEIYGLDPNAVKSSGSV